jgi:hypothetical protein
LVQRGNELTAEALAYLAELEERKLHLQLGFTPSGITKRVASLFAYCVEALGLSEGSAGRRVAAARVCRRFPEAFELVARGDLHLSALCGLAPHLNPENATELFIACCRRTRRQVDELLAARFPKPDVREQIRRLPGRGSAHPVVSQARIPGRTESQEEALARASVVSQGHDAARQETEKVGEECGSEAAVASAVEGPVAPAPAPTPGFNPRYRRELEALSADRFGVHFTADAALKDLLDRARALASHRLPKNDLSSLMRLVLERFVKHEEARRFAVGQKPRGTRVARRDARRGETSAADATHTQGPPVGATPPGEGQAATASGEGKPALVGSRASEVDTRFSKRRRRSRYVPAAVRRAVYLRDHSRCSFVSEDGRRCEARALLELDHIEPWARRGGEGLDNIRLLCQAHNQLHAQECFGARHIEAKIAARRRGTAPGAANGDQSGELPRPPTAERS